MSELKVVPWHELDHKFGHVKPNRYRVENPGVRISGTKVLIEGQERHVLSVDTIFMDCEQTLNTFIVHLKPPKIKAKRLQCKDLPDSDVLVWFHSGDLPPAEIPHALFIAKLLKLSRRGFLVRHRSIARCDRTENIRHHYSLTMKGVYQVNRMITINNNRLIEFTK